MFSCFYTNQLPALTRVLARERPSMRTPLYFYYSCIFFHVVVPAVFSPGKLDSRLYDCRACFPSCPPRTTLTKINFQLKSNCVWNYFCGEPVWISCRMRTLPFVTASARYFAKCLLGMLFHTTIFYFIFCVTRRECLAGMCASYSPYLLERVCCIFSCWHRM